MGTIESVPVVSQVKSLVQVIGGDKEGARRTQEEFIRRGVVASQVNSLVHAIKGDNAEAKKIQEEFAAEAETVVESLPVVGHGIAAGYAIAGDNERAEQIAIGATKSTVVAAAGVAGAVCGPGAPACGAAFAVSANAAWDGVDSAVSGKNKGIVKQVDDLVNGKATVDSTFDFVAGQSLLAAGGAMGAQGARNVLKAKANKARVANKLKYCKRSVPDHKPIFFNTELGTLEQNQLVPALPGSIHELQPDSWNQTDASLFANNVFSIFFILSLMKVGHPKSKPYYDEICANVYPDMQLETCYFTLQESLIKYSEEPKPNGNVFEDTLSTLIFEMNHILKGTPVGQGILSTICNSLSVSLEEKCKSTVDSAVEKLKALVKSLHLQTIHIRKKRTTSGCAPRFKGIVVSSTDDFIARHGMPDEAFSKYFNKKGRLTNSEQATLANRRYNIDSSAPSRNTIISEANAKSILDISSDTGSTMRRTGHAIYITDDPVPFIQTDLVTGRAVRYNGHVRFSGKFVDGEFKINHMIGPVVDPLNF